MWDSDIVFLMPPNMRLFLKIYSQSLLGPLENMIESIEVFIKMAPNDAHHSKNLQNLLLFFICKKWQTLLSNGAQCGKVIVFFLNGDQHRAYFLNIFPVVVWTFRTQSLSNWTVTHIFICPCYHQMALNTG